MRALAYYSLRLVMIKGRVGGMNPTCRKERGDSDGRRNAANDRVKRVALLREDIEARIGIDL
jgi:hypothetical protein